MAYDKNTKLITLDKVVIGGEDFLMTTKEREEWEKEQKNKKRIHVYKDNFNIRQLNKMNMERTIW